MSCFTAAIQSNPDEEVFLLPYQMHNILHFDVVYAIPKHDEATEFSTYNRNADLGWYQAVQEEWW
ncbi:hypothetical protein J6590_033185 [Homalodisca vitripennis]|nr:hypothetical protein J6590_033185 [Homalodisca vitripennis]